MVTCETCLINRARLQCAAWHIVGKSPEWMAAKLTQKQGVSFYVDDEVIYRYHVSNPVHIWNAKNA